MSLRYDRARRSTYTVVLMSSPQEISSVVYLSDGAPEGISNALRRFSSATRVNCNLSLSMEVGLLTLSIKARRLCVVYTIYHRPPRHAATWARNILVWCCWVCVHGPKGYVLARHSQYAPHHRTNDRFFVSVSPVSEIRLSLVVRRAEGNLVQQLDGKNPAALLLQALRTSGLDQQSSMDNLYVGLVDGQSLQVGLYSVCFTVYLY